MPEPAMKARRLPKTSGQGAAVIKSSQGASGEGRYDDGRHYELE